MTNYCEEDRPFLFKDDILAVCFGFSDFYYNNEVILMHFSLSWMIERFKEITGLKDEEIKGLKIRQQGEYCKCEGMTIMYVKVNKDREFPPEWRCENNSWEIY